MLLNCQQLHFMRIDIAVNNTLPKAKPRRSTAQIPAIRVSISMNKVRYYGNLNANIRFHINGAYLRNSSNETQMGQQAMGQNRYPILWTPSQEASTQTPTRPHQMCARPTTAGHDQFSTVQNPRPNAEKMPLL